MREVVMIGGDVDGRDDPQIQSTADAHWQFRIAGSNTVPTAQKSIGSLPSQQLKYPRQSMFPGQSTGAAARPCRFLSAQNGPRTVEVIFVLVDCNCQDEDVVVVVAILGNVLVVVVGEGETVESQCQTNKDDHWHTLSARSNMVPGAQRSMGSSPCQQLK
jgi:hypothetical protein